MMARKGKEREGKGRKAKEMEGNGRKGKGREGKEGKRQNSWGLVEAQSCEHAAQTGGIPRGCL